MQQGETPQGPPLLTRERPPAPSRCRGLSAFSLWSVGADHPALEVRGQTFSITASIALSLAGAGDDPEKLLSRADGATYAAKRNGRDRIETHQKA